MRVAAHRSRRRPVSACLLASLLYFLAPSSSACKDDVRARAQASQDRAYEDWRKSLDFGFLERPYAECRIGPVPHPLPVVEACYIAKLSRRCTEADDCLVQCLASGMNRKVAGGCWHLCFASRFELSSWSEPPGWGACIPVAE